MLIPSEQIKATMDEQIARIRTALEDRDIRALSKKAGLHENTVRNLYHGRGGSHPDTIKKLSEYLFGAPAQNKA